MNLHLSLLADLAPMPPMWFRLARIYMNLPVPLSFRITALNAASPIHSSNLVWPWPSWSWTPLNYAVNMILPCEDFHESYDITSPWYSSSDVLSIRHESPFPFNVYKPPPPSCGWISQWHQHSVTPPWCSTTAMKHPSSSRLATGNLPFVDPASAVVP